MSAAPMTASVSTGDLWTLEDLERLWKPRGKTALARRKWLWRRIHAWGIPHDGDRYDPRFIPGEVLRCMERHIGRARR